MSSGRRSIDLQVLAEIIIGAADRKERSWDKSQVQYSLTLDSCITEELDTRGISREFRLPISLAFHWWNDLLDWAMGVAGGESRDHE